MFDPQAAEDLVGQTLLEAARSWRMFDGRYPRSWLIGILRNTYLKSLRHAASRPRTVPLTEDCASTESGWDGLGRENAKAKLLEELDRLPEEYRLAFVLCDGEGMTYDEAAHAMGVSRGTVCSRLFRARRLLQKNLASFLDDTQNH
jgi:RNA polymerase sigma-70 factor (ECF subfamily)